MYHLGLRGKDHWCRSVLAASPQLSGKVMTNLIEALLGDGHGQMKQKIGTLYALLIGFNIVAWVWAFAAFHQYPLLLGTSLLAWSFGLRHAVDADHIAAIDNVTRKLMQDGKRPIVVGLMFSLGHSTIVALASLGIAATALAMKSHMVGFKAIGGLIGTLVSTFFLFAIALMNLGGHRRVPPGEARRALC